MGFASGMRLVRCVRPVARVANLDRVLGLLIDLERRIEERVARLGASLACGGVLRVNFLFDRLA